MTQQENKQYFKFLGELNKAKADFKNVHREDIVINYEEAEKRAKEGKSLIDIEKIEIDEKLMDELLQILCPILKKYEAFSLLEIQDLMENREKIDFAKLIRSVLIGDLKDLKFVADQPSLNSSLLLFIGLNSAQTLMEFYLKKLGDKIDHESWLKGNCPLCGSFPAMEKLRREDGKRILWCGLCGTQWHFKRIMCPFCGNEDHNSLRYFFTRGDPSSDENPFRVDVCDKCKRYIKTIDERKIPENEFPDFSLENINTLYLDILAQKDGYQSPTYWMISPSEKKSV
jgi:FdhE protein